MKRRGTSPDRRAPAPAGMTRADLVALVDGPLAGHWFHATDWIERRSAAEHMGHTALHPAGTALGYRPKLGRADVDHPTYAGVVGRAWRWQP